jgi:hypothetical protein
MGFGTQAPSLQAFLRPHICAGQKGSIRSRRKWIKRLLQLRVLGFGFFQDGDVGVFPRLRKSIPDYCLPTTQPEPRNPKTPSTRWRFCDFTTLRRFSLSVRSEPKQYRSNLSRMSALGRGQLRRFLQFPLCSSFDGDDLR